MKQIAVYTALFGDYDTLKVPPRDPDCDYFCFSDRTDLKSDIYEMRIESRKYKHPAKDARYYKILSHKVLPQYKYTLWTDASSSFSFNNIREFIEKAISKAPVAFHRHPSNDDIYSELERCICSRKDDEMKMKNQVSRYRTEGYPAGGGLIASGAIVRNASDPRIQPLENAWWQEIEQGSHRDQLSFNYIAWKLGVCYDTFDTLAYLPNNNPEFVSQYFEFWRHKK